MIQRMQTMWMMLTVAMVCIVIFVPVGYCSVDGANIRLMTYGFKMVTGQVLVYGGEAVEGSLLSPTLAVCLVALLVLAALVPLVTVFLYKKRRLQARLLGSEFVLLLGGAGLLGYYIWTYHRLMAEYADNFFLSFFPLVIVLAMLTNWFAIRGVLQDEILVRAADRIR